MLGWVRASAGSANDEYVWDMVDRRGGAHRGGASDRDLLSARHRHRLACGGIAAWLGWGAANQWLTAGILGIVAVTLLQWWKRGRATPQQPGLDVGQMVHVQSWGPGRTARVSYRGSTWDAELATPDTPQAETMYIAATRGSVLILAASRPSAVEG